MSRRHACSRRSKEQSPQGHDGCRRMASSICGIITVSPGKGGLGTFALRLDRAGNSVKGQLVAKFMSQQLGLDLFISQTEV
jgi:hypothetical protein